MFACMYAYIYIYTHIYIYTYIISSVVLFDCSRYVGTVLLHRIEKALWSKIGGSRGRLAQGWRLGRR
jgi:hypothetical protein